VCLHLSRSCFCAESPLRGTVQKFVGPLAMTGWLPLQGGLYFHCYLLMYVSHCCCYPYFPAYKPRLFFRKFHGSGLYSGAAYVRTFPKYHTLHTARCGMPRSALDHDQLTHSTPQSLTVSAAVWPPLPRPPCLSLSLSVYAWCLIPVAVNCTAVCGVCLLHTPAEHGKTPA